MGFFSEIIASEARWDMAQSPVSTRQTAAVPPPVAAGSETNSPPTVATEAPPAPTVTTPTLDLSADAEAADEAERKRAHEEAEPKRKAEWDAKQAAKKAARQEQLERINAMNDAELLAASVERVAADTERLTRRNMREAVAEHIQAKCREDAAFARLVMAPEKSMIKELPKNKLTISIDKYKRIKENVSIANGRIETCQIIQMLSFLNRC